MRFTAARLRTSRDVLADYPFGQLETALARLSDIFGTTVTAEELGKAFERAGWSSPENYMSDAPRSHCRTCRCRMRK